MNIRTVLFILICMGTPYLSAIGIVRNVQFFYDSIGDAVAHNFPEYIPQRILLPMPDESFFAEGCIFFKTAVGHGRKAKNHYFRFNTTTNELIELTQHEFPFKKPYKFDH